MDGWRQEIAVVASPAVASGFTVREPQAVVERIVLLSFALVTDANAANRIVRVEYLDGGTTVVAAVAAAVVQAASITTRYTFGVGLQQFGAASGAFIGGPLPDVLLQNNTAVRVAIGAVQAGDQVSGIGLVVEQRPTLGEG